ncbi:MAG: NADH-quinone oxidoreductase subunit [Frankiaceae bacterium]|nr:NADH-quinone oxidoreductase subunit [Frankiaceae bacterium]
MSASSSLWLLVALPLLGSVILLLAGKRADGWGHWLGTGAAVASFGVGLAQVIALAGKAADHRTVIDNVYSWIPVGGLHVDVAFRLDQLSALFLLLITGVGSLIHVYSIGYMAHDPGRRRFFAYLNLFVAAMLALVLADNYVLLYVGWEGVGLASYLLIGFWYHKPTAATAAKKAFIMNRVGDVGLALAIFLMFQQLGRIDFGGVSAGIGAVNAASHGTVTAIGLLLLLAACGKSAQLPLQAWLADAMEGPTPVSALIHAATMVTAGVYLIARSHFIFDLSAGARMVVAIVGTATLLYGAIIGTAYDDIKKVLASSTMSQIGYMMLGVGLGPVGYAFGIIHLLAHGFFKAGLFLGAGSVMHAMDDEVDMRRYGGLRKVMPWTFATFGLGYLALIGFPGLSGFWTKDKIIEAAFVKGGASGVIFGAVALLAVALTAFYMTRLMYMTFFGEKRWADGVHPHEAPTVMVWPNIVLAFGSVFGGFLLIHVMHIQTWLEPVLGKPVEAKPVLSTVVLTVLGILAMAGGAAAAYWLFGRRAIPQTAPAAGPLVRATRKQLYADAFNEGVFMRPGQYLTRALVFADNRGVDGGVNGVAAFIGGTSGRLRRLQTGFVRSYALSLFAGAVVITAALLLVRVA